MNNIKFPTTNIYIKQNCKLDAWTISRDAFTTCIYSDNKNLKIKTF